MCITVSEPPVLHILQPAHFSAFPQSADNAKIHRILCYPTCLRLLFHPSQRSLACSFPDLHTHSFLLSLELPRALGLRISGFGSRCNVLTLFTPVHRQALTKASGKPENAMATGYARVYPTTRRRFCAHPAAPPWTPATATPRRRLHPYPYQEMKEAALPPAPEAASYWRGQGTPMGRLPVSAPQQQVDSSAVHCCSAGSGLVGAAAPWAARGDHYEAR